MVTKSSDGIEATLQDIVLEPDQLQVEKFHWGALPHLNSDTADLHDLRSYRAAILPIALVDVPEHINYFDWNLGFIGNDSVVFNHRFSDRFPHATYGDELWMALRVVRLLNPQDDLAAVAHAAKLPASVEQLLLYKLQSRWDNMNKLFSLKAPTIRPQGDQDPALRYTSSDGLIKNGQAMLKNLPGYAIDLSEGTKDDPINVKFWDGLAVEIGENFLFENIFVEKLNALVSKGLHLDRHSLEQAQTDHLTSIENEIEHNLETTPVSQPLPPLKKHILPPWSQTILGLRYDGSRVISTGSYFGSNQTLQLVDSASLTGSVGKFLAFDGIDKVQPQGVVNLSRTRSWVLVRPITLDKDHQNLSDQVAKANKMSFGDLLRDYMGGLSCALQSPDKPVPAAAGAATSPVLMRKHSGITEFFKRFPQNSVFIISDVVDKQPAVAINTNLPFLDGISFLGPLITPSLHISRNVQEVNRTTISYTSDGIEVVVSKIDNKTWDTGLSLSLGARFLRFLNLSGDDIQKKSSATTNVYRIAADPTTLPENQQEAEAKRFMEAMGPLLKHNDTEGLEKNYPPVTIVHRLSMKMQQLVILMIKKISNEYQLWTDVTPARQADNSFDRQNCVRKGFQTQITHVGGNNWQDFFSSLLSGIAKKEIMPAANGDDPADTLFGNSKRVDVTTIAEITAPTAHGTCNDSPEFHPVIYVDHTYGNWVIGHGALIKLIHNLRKEFSAWIPAGEGLAFDTKDLTATDKMRFNRITIRLRVLPQGVSNLRKALLPVVANGELDRLYQNLVDLDYQLPHPDGRGLSQWCQDEHLPEGIQSGFPMYALSVPSYTKDFKYIACIRPWMREILNLADTAPADLMPRAYLDRVDPNAQLLQAKKEAYVLWVNKFVALAEKNLPKKLFLSMLGKGGYFIQGQISGLRVGDETAYNNQVMYSSTVGVIPPSEGDDFYNEMNKSTGVAVRNFRGSFLTEGY